MRQYKTMGSPDFSPETSVQLIPGKCPTVMKSVLSVHMKGAFPT